MSRMRIIPIVLITIALTLFTEFAIYAIYSFRSAYLPWKTLKEQERAKEIFETLGLDTRSDARLDVLLYRDTHEGFHGDGDTYAVIRVPDDPFPSGLDSLQTPEGWTVEPVTLASKRAIMERLLTSDLFQYLSIDIRGSYDAWYFWDDYYKQYCEKADEFGQSPLVEGIPNGSYPNYTIAFYDQETGILLYYSYDS